MLTRLATRVERRLFERVSGGTGTNYGYRPGAILDTVRRASLVRSLYYSRRLRGRVVVDRHARVRIARDATVSLRPGATLIVGIDPPGRGTNLEIFPRARVRFDGSVTIMGGAHVRVGHDARLRMGDRSYLNADTRLVCEDHVEVGAGCAISWNVTITDSDLHQLRRSGTTGPTRRPVEIADHVWIGAGATVLKGTHLGAGSVVAAGSVVTRSVPAGALVAGNPARVVDTDVVWAM